MAMQLKDRLRLFMEDYKLEHEEMAAKLSTPYGTFKNWMRSGDDSTQPPACMFTMMNILERSHEARAILGIVRREA